MRNKIVVILIALLLLCSVSGSIIPAKNFIGKNVNYKSEELNNTIRSSFDTKSLSRNEYFKLLEKYPYFLNGTILDGRFRVVVSENGTPPSDMEPNDYDYCLNKLEMKTICESARAKFIRSYGFDPYPPEPDQKNIIISYGEYLEKQQLVSSSGGPHEMFGSIVVKVFPAKNSRDKPRNPYELYRSTEDGFNRFTPEFKITTFTYFLEGYWDASDVSSNDIYNYLVDLGDDVDQYLNYDNQVAMGWVKDAAGGTGKAWISGFFSVAKEKSNFRHEEIAQHEISHNFGAKDHGFFSWPPCLMGYLWLWLRIGNWCKRCHEIIYNQIWNYE